MKDETTKENKLPINAFNLHSPNFRITRAHSFHYYSLFLTSFPQFIRRNSYDTPDTITTDTVRMILVDFN